MKNSICLFLALATLGLTRTEAQINPVAKLNKVVWVWLENTPANQMSAQNYIRSLGLYYPIAEFSHFLPSSTVTQANVMMMIGGSDFGITDNSLTRIASPTLLDLLESKNIPWKVYAEDFPGACYLGAGTGNYQRYRVPFLSVSHVQSDRYECMKIVGFGKFTEDLNYGAVPQFSVLIPNLVNSGAISNPTTADIALRTILDPIVTAPDFVSTTTVFISTINNNSTTSPAAFAAIIGAGVQVGVTTIATKYSHAHLLKTIETGLELGNLHQADMSAEAMVGFWK